MEYSNVLLYSEETDLIMKREGENPVCSDCKQALKIGDLIDHHYPHYTENNLCKKCELKREP